jgi:hypothetical protein
MTIKIDNLTYDLSDPETNPDNTIKASAFELPSSLVIEQEAIDKLYGQDFEATRDMAELISCHTGFEPNNYTYEVVS